jgi:NADH pyrophosphatase NudC (nudix superfamily)
MGSDTEVELIHAISKVHESASNDTFSYVCGSKQIPRHDRYAEQESQCDTHIYPVICRS